jgi:hypothetical protein
LEEVWERGTVVPSLKLANEFAIEVCRKVEKMKLQSEKGLMTRHHQEKKWTAEAE